MTKDGLKKEASMLDLSADNQDGFDDTDGQLYTSNSLLFFIRENNKASNEEKLKHLFYWRFLL